ncbi:mitochondrial ribonuclease P catalytic subunit isoform X2 [Belonocnema kinseyi]|nr:mitochondrial ribonuclease P catalytic subunit isoform X2 [Belonocnema kinseyi]XP_033207095.1 mitochondrial ribonuclease P catalytic subunit isoform X2 [Belonocnema kinseyi]
MSLLTRRLMRSFRQVRFLQIAAGRGRKQLPFLERILNSDVNLVSLLDSQKALTQEDWKKGREELLEFDFLNGKNIDAAVANLCFTLNNTNAFISYIHFLKNNNYEINLYMAGKYVFIFRAKKSMITDSEKQEICAMYDFVRKKYPILDAESCERFIYGLCLTDRWEESIQLLDMMKMSTKINPSPLTVIISTAFSRGKAGIGWKYMNLAYEENILILPEAYSSYLQYCLNTFKSKKELEINMLKMFEFLKETEKILGDRILNDYLHAFKELGYTYTQTSISRLGRCAKCSHQLPAPDISKEEFDKMSKLFMEKVVVGGNVYYNSTPKEFKQFMQFLEKAQPYDIVIDGLNIACAGVFEKDRVQKASRLSKAVEYFLNTDKKILLLGRQHMLKWKYMDYIRHNTQMFLVDNSSSDDPHLLYATLYGGMKTCFVSMDLMRQHKFQLPRNMQGLFKRWQLSHQYMIDTATLNVKSPVKFEIITQNCGNSWHIPYYSGMSTIAKDSYEATTNWICLKKQNK